MIKLLGHRFSQMNLGPKPFPRRCLEKVALKGKLDFSII